MHEFYLLMIANDIIQEINNFIKRIRAIFNMKMKPYPKY